MTANTLSEFWRIIRAYWYIGNDEAQHFVRQIILTVLIGGGALMCISLLGIPALTATATLVLLIGGPARILWQCKYPLIVPIGAIVLPKIDENAWKLVKEVAWRAAQALTLFGIVGLYFSTLSPLIKLPLLERLSLAPIFALAFVVAGLCYLVGWRVQSATILVATALFSLVIRVGGLEKVTDSIKTLGSNLVQQAATPAPNTTTSPGTQADIPAAYEPPARVETTIRTDRTELGVGNNVVTLPAGTRYQYFVLKAGNTNLTEIVRTPSGASQCGIYPRKDVKVVALHSDGTWGAPYTDGPLHNTPPFWSPPRALRFQWLDDGTTNDVEVLVTYRSGNPGDSQP